MPDPHSLQRFIDAQASVYADVLAELRAGRKTSHWMWFIFPQCKGLGRSSTAQHFAITSLAEARAYLEHPTLGARLRECTKLVNQLDHKSIEQILGSPDNLKFRSSMTLFLQASPPGSSDYQLFTSAIEKHFHGQPDPLTLSLINV
jgi:uncharacterized protein (DUF1810 family)